ncbi:molecular chaperone GrpE [Paucidesulfovibrio gracilis DSM 16080]|uniref:Protein GrpE n=1 Tax=Paucidesulfovibrio gracilis DSM 16080 TaxID=1121449 RepID=A0A1T4WB46_9BACT|nr:nucleotide exchange factor GrpE [Paucidesulfovibrio gracilis]SKA74512.1 molecular chaperone GrpE [Paucidesulfovibrio gracilis DSM 16080]
MSDEKIKQAAEQEAPEAQEAPQEIDLSEEELEALCRERVCPGCNVMQEADDLRLRALADTENVKKRLARETEELRKYAGESVLADLLPVLDNLDLALEHAKGLEACADFVTGVEMTRKIFLDTLERHGLAPVRGEQGGEFDPNLHEAVGMACQEGVPDGCIAQQVQRGYSLKGRLLRPAKVMVNKTES